ncbi:putative membrane protein C6F6.04c [Exophiala dermatitidis]
MAVKIPGAPPLRLHSPYWQNVIIGILVGLTAGLYVALNLLGAGGGRPNSASTVQVVNATLCTVWFFSASFGGSVLNKIGPAITASLGVLGYVIYVGSLWYFDQTGKQGFPIFAGVCIGISAGLIFVTMGYIAMSYSEEQDRGKFITMSINLQAVGAVVGGIIPLIINKDSTEAAGVPAPVYIVFIVMMGLGMIGAFALMPPSKITRDDGTQVGLVQARTFVEELKSNLEIFKDWKLLIMVPGFLPAECFLVYGGSVNAYHNNLRTRCLLSFLAVVIQIPAGWALQAILDHKKWKRQTRAFIGLAVVGIPLIGAWVWEIIRVRHYDRSNPPARPMDWTDDGFVAIFFLFIMNWVFSSLWQYIILYFLGTLTNSPRKSANYAGVFRGFLGAGEAICFGVDSTEVPYMKEAAVIFAFYTAGVLIFAYLALYHIRETEYFNGEDDVVIPKHVLEEHPEAVTMEGKQSV